MSAAAQQYQEAIHKYQPRRESPSQPPEPQMDGSGSAEPPAASVAVISEGQQQQGDHQQSPGPSKSLQQPSTQSPAPSRQQGSSTPTRNTNGTSETPARTAVNNADAAASVPLQAVEHGAPFRRYLNSRVTPTLLEGMKQLALEQPKDPLRFLGEYLLQKSSELEAS
ncbi:MAG: ribosomal 40S subunit protein S13 [Chaenotheca gracillima]|nr:MAG: ribosomal 40S subunit protein S13 [Chaenotheca gracillima]